VTDKDSGSEIRKIYERPGALLPNAHGLKIPSKNRKKKSTRCGLILETDSYSYPFVFGLKFLFILRYIWIIRICRYLGYIKNTFWNRTPYHARQELL
jgi:hypothetical protein